MFNNYPRVNFHEGLPELSDEVFDGREPTLRIVDDLMAETNELVANIFTKISHRRNISVLYLTQNVFEKNKYNRTISLNAYNFVLFKNSRDGTQFATLSRYVSKLVQVCRRGLPGCHQRSLRLPVSRSQVRPRRSPFPTACLL